MTDSADLTPPTPGRSRIMRANKSKDTLPELTIRRGLWRKGLRGYRVHFKKAPGRPDICFVGRRLAIFVHGCFWHRCPKCAHKSPRTNTEFWESKFRRNQDRDLKNVTDLKEADWRVIIIWECEVLSDPSRILFTIEDALYAIGS